MPAKKKKEKEARSELAEMLQTIFDKAVIGRAEDKLREFQTAAMKDGRPMIAAIAETARAVIRCMDGLDDVDRRSPTIIGLNANIEGFNKREDDTAPGPDQKPDKVVIFDIVNVPVPMFFALEMMGQYLKSALKILVQYGWPGDYEPTNGDDDDDEPVEDDGESKLKGDDDGEEEHKCEECHLHGKCPIEARKKADEEYRCNLN